MVFDDHSDTEYDAYPRWTQVPYSPLPHVDELLEHLHEGFSDITSEAIIWKHFQRSDQKFVDLFTRIDPADWKISRSSAQVGNPDSLNSKALDPPYAAWSLLTNCQFLLQLLYSQLGFTTDFDLLADWDDIEKWYDKYNTLCDLWNSPAMIPYSSRVSYLTVSMDVHWDECSGGIRDGRHHTAKFSMIRTGDRDKPFACTGEVVTCEDRTHAVCVCLLYNRLRDVLALETGLTITANDGAATSDEARYRRAPGYVLLECLEFIVDHCRDMVDRFILGGYLPYDTCGICGLAPIAEHLVLNHRY